MTTAHFLRSAFALLSTTACALASQSQPPASDAADFQTRDHNSWNLRITPLAWYVAPSGDIQFPSQSTTSPEVSLDQLDADSPRLSPLGGLSVRSNNWLFSGGGFYLSMGDRGSTQSSAGRAGDLAFAAGDRLNTSIDFWSVEASVGYRILHRELGPRPQGGHKVVLDITPLVGVRVTNVDLSVDRQAGGSTSYDSTFWEPIAGARADLELFEDFSIALTSTIGYWPDTDLSWDIMPQFTWRPIHWLGIQGGYRQLLFDLEDGSGAGAFKWDGGVAGFLFGAELRF